MIYNLYRIVCHSGLIIEISILLQTPFSPKFRRRPLSKKKVASAPYTRKPDNTATVFNCAIKENTRQTFDVQRFLHTTRHVTATVRKETCASHFRFTEIVLFVFILSSRKVFFVTNKPFPTATQFQIFVWRFLQLLSLCSMSQLEITRAYFLYIQY